MLFRIILALVFAIALSAGARSQTLSGNPQNVILLGQSWAGGSSSGADTTEDTLATITVPANAIGANGCVSIDTLWTFNATSTGTKTVRVRFSGASGTQYYNFAHTTANSEVWAQTKFCNRNATGSQVGPATFSNMYSPGVASVQTSSVDTTASTTVVITCQKGNSADTCTLEGYSVTLVK